MSSAFISYAHEDQEFVLELYRRLLDQGLDVRYDQVALHIGDSLIRALSREIAEGDFLIAVISPDSVESEWCQTELSLARTQGIDAHRVKVLPVRYRGAPMPSMLSDTFWGDADRYDVNTIARQLAAAIEAHLGGDAAAAAAAAAEVADEGTGTPAHSEIAGDVQVGDVDTVAERVWDVLALWERVREGSGATSTIVDKQRRLRWALEALPERVRAALPLVARLSVAEWQDYFRVVRPDQAEPDLREEMRSVRTQVAQGLPVPRRWFIDQDLGEVGSEGRDASVFLWGIARGDETRRVTVFISRTAMASTTGLPQEVAEAKASRGRSVVRTLLALDEPPTTISVTTAGISSRLPD
jgi:hypothetical protein